MGKRIRAARREAGFRNVEQVAVALDVAARTVQRWEQDDSEPSLTQLRELALLTGRPLKFFYEEAAA